MRWHRDSSFKLPRFQKSSPPSCPQSRARTRPQTSRSKKKKKMLACRNIVTISGTKGDGEARVLNSREWHEAVYARGIPSAPSSFCPYLRFLFIAKVRAEGRREEREQGGTVGRGRVRTDEGRTMHNGRSSGRLKCNGGTAMRSCVSGSGSR